MPLKRVNLLIARVTWSAVLFMAFTFLSGCPRSWWVSMELLYKCTNMTKTVIWMARLLILIFFHLFFFFFLSQNMEIRSNTNKCSDLIFVCRGLSQSRRNNSFVFNCGAQHLVFQWQTQSGEKVYKFAADRIVCKIKMKIIQSDSDNLIARAVSIRIKHNSNQTDQSPIPKTAWYFEF